jgi:hypothetical protein
MTSLREEQHAFYRERVPEQFNRTLELQGEKARRDTDAERLLNEMRAVGALIRVEVASGEDADVHLLEIEQGKMKAVDRSSRRPFFSLAHEIAHFENLRRRCGDSVLGFLGGLAGLEEEMLLTPQRVQSLRDLKGALRLEVEGDSGFVLEASFGVDPARAETSASIRLSPEVFEALQSGALDAQDAFFDEKVAVEGDLEIAIGAALAALSPE